ncbi:unnamed protein product [Oppiella nova]|uniref:Cytochrome b5 heme-binding domain-containing protein n=1 Tax=Oppiella nova TaxID=334625 RepID=A0A7R9QDG7_9ACAR|nr:unnamed protein product [Oppiella nova]CAG2163669.1 unnamed protein product [Oppiella nova]
MDKTTANSGQDREFTRDEVRDHNETDSLWVIVESKVYDITHFLGEHPGGRDILREYGGMDATNRFREVEHSADAIEMMKAYKIGRVVGEDIATQWDDGDGGDGSTQQLAEQYSITVGWLPMLIGIGVTLISYYVINYSF